MGFDKGGNLGQVSWEPDQPQMVQNSVLHLVYIILFLKSMLGHCLSADSEGSEWRSQDKAEKERKAVSHGSVVDGAHWRLIQGSSEFSI